MIKLFLLTMLVFLPGSAFANETAASDDALYFLDVPEEADATMSTDEAGYDALQRRPNRPPRRQPPRRQPRRNERWYFLGCTNSDFNCSWAATRYGFRDYITQWDIRCRSAAYACYGRNRW